MANNSVRQPSDSNVVDLEMTDLSAHASAGGNGQPPLLVLTRDAQLVDTVRKSTPRGTRVVSAPSLDQAAGQLPTLQPGVLVADSASVTDLSAMVAQLTQHFPDLVVVAVGKSEDSQALMRLTAAGQIYRFLLQPLSHGQTKLTLEAAVNRHQELTSSAKRRSSGNGDTDKKANPLVLGAVGVGVLALVGAIWMFMSKTSDKVEHATQATTAVVQQSPAQNELNLAKKALADGKLVEPAGESALDLYRSALSIDPTSQAAKDGIRAVADKVLERAETALSAEKLEDAIASIELARDIQADHPRLAFLDKQVARERERLKLTQAQEVGGRVRVLLAQASQRMEADKLTTPPGESARDSLLEARKLDPTDPAVQQSIKDLANRLVDAAKLAAVNGNLETAQSLGNAARQLGYGGSGLASVERALSDARAAAGKRANVDSEIAAARKRLNEGQLIEPAGDSAKDHIAAARAGDAGRSELNELTSVLAVKLVDQGKQALNAQQLDRAKQLATAARDTGARNQEAVIAQLERDIEAQRAKAAAATKSVSNVKSDAQPVTSTITLKRTRTVPPEMPAIAMSRKIVGWVEVTFTVNEKGRVEDAAVRSSSPEDVFDEAALKAVRQWRFDPPLRDGQPTSTRSMIRLKFDPTQQ
jgi:TonB family protein